MIKAKVDLSSHQYEAELFVRDNGSKLQRLDSRNRLCTFVAKMPVSAKFYVALTSLAFKQYICDWLGSINDCYVLQSNFLKGAFEYVKPWNVL